LDETEACVQSIQANIDTPEYHIVIVDNHSPNQTGKKLAEKYATSDNVSVILSEENLGFARGNNLGIDYARKILKAKFVCAMNNDTILEQKDFFKCVQEEYTVHNMAVIGPMVINNDGAIHKYGGGISLNKSKFEEVLLTMTNPSFKTKLLRQLYIMPIFGKYIKNYFLKKIFRDCGDYYENYHEDVLLFGCCLIFTPTFFEKLDGFNPKTFMYREEELLLLALRKKNLKSAYCPKLQIRHIGEKATSTDYKTAQQREAFHIKYQIESLKILIDELEGYEEVY
jgi:GT2 family glycosyltransferase